MNEQNMHRLHESLGQLDSNFTRTYDEFVQDMQDDGKRRRLHASLGNLDSNFTRTYEEFSQDMGLSVSSPQDQLGEARETAQHAKNNALQVEDVTRPEDYDGDGSFYGLSDDDLRSQIDALNAAREAKKEETRKEIRASKKSFWTRLSDALIDSNPNDIGGYTNSSVRDQALVDMTKLTPEEEERYNRLVQEQTWRQRQAGSEYEQLGQSLLEAKDRLATARERDGRSLDTGGADAYLDKAISLYQAPSKFGNSSGVKNWAVGLGDQLADYDTWTVGVTEMARAINLNALVDKLNNEEELTESEEAELEAFLLYGAVQDARQNDLSVGYTIGKGTAESIPFMAEMFITAGVGAAAKKALIKTLVKGGNKVAAKRLARAFGEEFVETEVRKKSGKIVKDITLKEVKQSALERVGRQVSEDVLMTAFMPTTWAAVNNDAVEEKLSGDGEYGFGDFLRTFAGSTIETGTEHWGGKIVDKALGKVMPLDKIWGKTRWGKLLTNDFIQSPFGETGEEYVGAVANYIRSYNPAYSDESNEELRKEARQMFSIDGFAQTFLTVLPMSAFGGGVNAGVMMHHISNYKTTKNELISLLKDYGADDEQAANILMQIEGAEDTQSFTEMLAQTERTLRMEYMNSHPDADVEEIKKHFAKLDKLVGKYFKHAYYLNETSSELQNAYAQLPEEQKQQVMQDFATAITMQAQDADARIQAEMERRAKVKTEESETPAEEETAEESGEQPAAETEEKHDEPKQIIPREVEINVNGAPTKVQIVGKGVYESDGSIDFSGNRHLYLMDMDGNPIPASMREEVQSAINDYLRMEKENGDELMRHDPPVEQVPVVEEEEPVDEKLYPTLEDGSPDYENMNPEQQVIYATEVGGEEAAMETIQTALEELTAELESMNKKKGLTPVQKVAEKNRIRQDIAAWQALMPQTEETPADPAEEPVTEESPAIDETPETTEAPETPETTETPAEPVVEESVSETEEPQNQERISLQEDNIAILLHDISEDKVPLLKVVRVSDEDVVRVYREIGTDKELSVADGYWREMPKQLIHEGESDYINIKYRDKQTKRLGIPLFLTEPEIAAINAQNENRPKVDKLPNRGLTQLSKEAKGQGVGYFADMPLDAILEEPLTKVGNTQEVFTMRDLLAMSPMMIVNENGRKVRRSIWNQVVDWCEQAAVRSVRKSSGSEYSEERVKELKSDLLADIKKAIPRLMDGWNAIVKKKGIDELFSSTVNVDGNEVPVMNLLDEDLLATYKLLRKAIFNEETDGNPTLIFPANKRRFTEGWYNPAKNAEHPMGEDANIFRYMQTVGELARQLQDWIGLENSETSFMNVEKTFTFPYNRTVARGREKRNDNAETQYRELLERIANANNIKELRKIAQVRYSWQEPNTRSAKGEAYDTNPNYDADKTNAVYEALSQRASDFGATLAMLQTEDAMQEREEKEMSEEERAAAAAAEDMKEEEQTENGGLETQIAELEAEHQKTLERLAMARERKNADMEEMLLEKANDISKQIFALRQQMVRATIHETEEQTKWRKEHGRRVVSALRNAGANISLVSEEEMFSFFDAREVRLMKTNGSVPYGVEVEGKLYILDDYLDPNTPVHEYTHLWFDLYAQKHPSKWAELMDVLKQTDAWQDVLNDENYFDIHDNEYEMTSEVLARLTGDYWSDSFMGSTRLEDAVEQKKLTAKVRAAIRSFWETVCGWFDQKISRRNKDFDSKLREILNMPMQDIIRTETGGLTEEEQAIKERAQKDGTFMKAPNGEPTKLTEKQWLQVRTRAFMDWFGDWIKVPRLEKLRNSEPINVEFNGEYELNRDSAKDWAKKNIRTEYVNADTQERIVVSGVGIDEVMSHGEREEEHLKSVVAIPQMIEQSIFIEESGPEHPNSKFDRYRYYVCGVKIDGVDYTAKVVIGVKNGVRYYDHQLTQIEKGRLIDSLNELPNPVANNQASKIDRKDTKLSSILQTNSVKKLYFSKILDENGEPKVLYRGSNNPESYVFHSRYKSGAVWFTDNVDVARHYATRYADHELTDEEIEARIQPVFLNIADYSFFDAHGRNWDEAVNEPVYFVFDDDDNVLSHSRNREDVEKYCIEHGLDPDIEITESRSTGDIAELEMLDGKDGVMFSNIIDGGDIAANVYVIKSNTRAKSATINIGSFDGSNPDIRFRIGPSANILENEDEPLQPVKRMSWLQRKVNAALDQANGLRLLMKNIGDIEGKKVRADEDVREALEAKRSKITNTLTMFGTHERRHLKKALRAIQKSIKNSGLWKKGMTDYYVSSNGTRSDRDVTLINVLEMYLMAKDTLERISQGKEVRSPELTFRSLQLLDMPVETEIETQEQQMAVLQAVVDKFEGTIDAKQISALWSAVNECTRFTLRKLKDGGLLGENVYQELMKSQFYVPERGFAQLESDEDVRQEVTGRKRGTRGNSPEALRAAHGGESMATDVIANILHLATNSVACAEENKVRQAAFNLLRNHGDACRQLGYPAAERVWFVRDGFNEDGTPRYTAQIEKPSSEIIAQNEEVLELIRGYRDDLELFAGNKAMQDYIKQQIEEAKKDLLLVSKRDAGGANLSRAGLAGEDVPKVLVSVPTEDGDIEQYTMVFPNQREIANALNGVLATKFSDSWLKSVGHFFSSMFTTYNPLFWSRNLPRDAMFVLQKGTAERGVGYGAFFAAEMARPATTILPIIEYVMGMDVDGREQSGSFATDGTIEREFRRFLEGGGNTGFTQMKDIEAFRREADRLVNGENPVGAGLGFIFKEVPAALNEFSELWTRFAVYRATKASLAMENRAIQTIGRGIADLKRTSPYSEEEIEAMALHDSRNFSTNFNRRGAGGFVDFFNSISIFANASIQGAMGVYRTFEQGEWQKGARGAVSLMFIPALLGYLLTKMTPDDDDKEKWIPDYIRQNNLVFLDKRVPLSYELVPWYRIGVNYALMEQGRLSKTDGIENIAMGFAEHSLPTPPAISEALKTTIDCVVPETDFNGKNPSLASAITSLMQAQFMSSFVELEHGKTWTGSNLRYQYAKDQPQWMFQDYEAELFKDISKGLYKTFGHGDMDNPSITVNGKKMNDFQNMSPKEIKNYIGSVTPNGWLKIACFAWGLGKDIANNDGVEYIRDNDKPFVSDFTVSQNAEMGRIGISAEMSAMIREAKENYTRVEGLRDLTPKEAEKRIKAWDKLYKDYTNTRLEAEGLTAGNLKAQKRRLERAYGIRFDGESIDDLLHAYILVMTNEEIEAKGLERTIGDIEKWQSKYQREKAQSKR